MALIGYARVSTQDQKLDLQKDALTAAGCERIFKEHKSGKNTERPELAKVLDHLREGDTLVVWKLDRLGRSLQDLVRIINELQERGVGFRTLDGHAVDTTTPGGKLVFHIFAALAEFERELNSERTKAGLAAASKAGRKGGRKHRITGTKLDMLLDQWDRKTPEEIAQALGVSRATVYRAYKRTQERSVTASRG